MCAKFRVFHCALDILVSAALILAAIIMDLGILGSIALFAGGWLLVIVIYAIWAIWAIAKGKAPP